VTGVEAYSLDKDSFLRLIEGTPVEAHIRAVAALRSGETWKVIQANPFLNGISSSQVTQLEAALEPVEAEAGQVLLREGAPCDGVWLVAEGRVDVVKEGRVLETAVRGVLVGNVFEARDGQPASRGAVAATDVRLFSIGREALGRFLTDNPGVTMKWLFAAEEGSA
jgi:CRP-like cAMP-binding protein